jgi:hypothetical protein
VAVLLQTYQNWIFVSVVKGGSAANAMVKSLDSEWGRKLYGRTLISNIGSAVYKVRRQQCCQIPGGSKAVQPAKCMMFYHS